MTCQTGSNQAHDSLLMTVFSTEEFKNQHDSAILRDDLNKLAAWEKKWGMAFHPDKCSVIRISRSRKTAPMNYTLKGHVLQNEDYTRYLGVELQSNLSWNSHIDQTVKTQIACWDS